MKESNIFKLKCSICNKKVGYIITKNPVQYNTDETISQISGKENNLKILCKECYNKLWRIQNET